MRAALLASTFFLPFALAGCGSVVHTETPALEVAPGIADAGGDVVGDVSRQYWWKDFGDKTLDGMVTRSMAENLSVQSAISRVTQAQASLEGTGLASSLSGGISAQARRSGSEGIDASTSKSVGFSPSIVLDLFGGQKEARDRALAQLEGSKLDEGTARLSVISGVVDTYLQARYLQQAVDITEDAVEKRRKTTQMTEDKTALGAGSELSAAQARVTLEQAEKSLSDLETSYRNSVYALATLLAEPADKVFAEMKTHGELPAPKGAAEKIPADLLRNRPDVRSAEQALAASAASVGVAKSQLYPSLSLSGSVSASAGTTGWSFGPSLSLPVLSQPSLRANVRSAEASMEQAHLAWKAAVLAAVEDASSAANTFDGAQRAVTTAQKVLKSQQHVVELTEFSFDAGSSTMLEVLEARQSLDDAKLSLLSAKRDRAQAWSNLQVAAGRGWAAQ